MNLNIEGSKSESQSQSTNSIASSVSGNNIKIDAGNSATVQGSHLQANNELSIDAEEINLLASQDTQSSNTDSKHISANVSIGTSGASVGVSGGVSSSKNQSTSHTNTTLNANNITLTSSKDTNIKGANVHGTESTTLNVGGDLNIASVQDSNREKSLGVSASASFSPERDDDNKETGRTSQGASLNANSSQGNYQAVTNQTSLTANNLTINTTNNTHLEGVIIDGKESTSITTGTLTSKDIQNKASYDAMSGGIAYSGVKGTNEGDGLTPVVGLPTEIDKGSLTRTALNENTTINITDQANQTQDTQSISRDTQNASHTLTQIDKEVIDIRTNLASELSKEGFNAIGDYAMAQAEGEGDEAWADGGWKKNLAHAGMGGLVAAVGNGDAVGGALGAGAREALSNATEGESEANQQWASALVGAIAGGGTGASVAIDGEKYNRQMHQEEIEWIEKNAAAFARELNGGKEPSEEQVRDAKARLTQQALRQVDKAWSYALGSKTDTEAQNFLYRGGAKLFTVKDEFEFKDGSTDGENEISHLSDEDYNHLKDFYSTNAHRTTSTNPDGSLRRLDDEFKKEKEAQLDAIANMGWDDVNQMLRDFVPNTVTGVMDIPDVVNSAGNYFDALPVTTNAERMDELYGQGSSGSRTQSNLAVMDTISTMGMATGVGVVGRSGGKAVLDSLDNQVDETLGDLDDRVPGVSGTGEISETLLSQKERVQLFNKELLEADKASNPQEALAIIDKVMTDIEDRHSGVEAKENPGLKYEGRMYAPREDFTEKLPDGSLIATSKGNIVHLGIDGSIKVYTKDKNGQADKLVLSKDGADTSNNVIQKEMDKNVLDDLHIKVESELSEKKNTNTQTIPEKVIRQDNDFSAMFNDKGNPKAYINEKGDLVPVNIEGTASITTQIRGGGSENSPYISTTDVSGDNVKPKAYGNNVIKIDTKKLQEDIDNDIVQDVEIITPKKIQEELQTKIDKAEERYNRNPTDNNAKRLNRAKLDLENTQRDNECLIKGCVPKEYIKETTHKEEGIE